MSITLTTVTPVYSGREYLSLLAQEIGALRAKWREESAPIRLVEAIFVDDGSVDGSADILRELSQQYPWVTVVTLSRNYGQHAATNAGICHSSGDWVVTLDEDLQHKPQFIEAMLSHQVKTKGDVIYAQPIHSAHGGSWRDKSSKLVKTLLAKLTVTDQITMFNSFRLVRGSIARAAASSSTSQTYFDIAISWFTKSCHVVALDLKDDRFVAGKQSGYGLRKLVRHARRLIVSLEIDVAFIGLVIGLGSVLGAGMIGLFAIVQKVLFPENIEIAGWASQITVITFFSGLIIFILCVILEYVSVLVANNLGRPTFFTIDREQDHLLHDWFGK